ncbi:ABC transporter permease [Desulfovibrio cuneatus]|uniref:ABC transporter permease n=1 Tax=Desulfovibrio cuneatus TaxID=159728 RepID=UPI0012EB18A3|nr:FtsX-like permease family protein [Desulfovibrio cuneatus]
MKAHNSRLGRMLVFSLCLEDLRNEKMLSFCMVMAVASVLGPLLILFGLKFGTVETLRGRLVHDPRNREIRPLNAQAYSHEWFQTVAKQEGVAFVVPYTRQLATGVDIVVPGPQGKRVAADLIPTAEGDPLVLQNGHSIPAKEECLLSAPLAEALGVAAGETVVMAARRTVGGQFETGERALKVLGVLPVRASATKSVFVPLPVLEAVERFKDGMGVPQFGWKGSIPLAYPAFSALLVNVPGPLGVEAEFRLVNNTGFTSKEQISGASAGAFLGRQHGPDGTNYLLSGKGQPGEATNLKTVRYGLAGRQARLFPLAPGLTLALSANGTSSGPWQLAPAGEMLVVNGGENAPATAGSHVGAAGEGQNAPPALLEGVLWQEDFSKEHNASAAWRAVLVPPGSVPPGKVVATLSAGEHSLSFPVTVAQGHGVQAGTALVPLRLLGVLTLAAHRPVTFDPETDAFILHRKGYAGFRLYADTLERVDTLRREFEAQGLAVHTEAQRIDDVLRLDKYLTLIFWLIALAGVVGGAACLVANVYSGIERKRRELAVLRLLGLSGGAFLRFPMYTAAVFSGLGFVVAMGLFYTLAGIINMLFSQHLQSGESLCRLAWWHPLAALGLTVAVSILAGVVAGRRAMLVDPAEALRNE